MTFTIAFGWWLAPLLITLGSYGYSVWRLISNRSPGDYGHIGQALALLVMLCASTIVSLVAWLAWALFA